MNDVWISMAAAVAVGGLLVAQWRWRSAQNAGKVMERVGAAARTKAAPVSRGPLLDGLAERVAGTFIGSKLAVYAARTHPGEIFSDLLAWGSVAFIAGLMTGTVIFGKLLPALMVATAAPVALDRFFVKRRGSRSARIERQLPDALTLQGSALRAGQSLTQSLRIVAEGSKAPLRDELERMINHIDLGMPSDDALEQFAARTYSRDMDLWVDAMLIHRQTGGSLARVVDSLSSRVSQRMNLRSEIRALTAQGRMSGYVVAAAPLALFLLLSMGSQEQMEVLYTTPLGWVILIAGLTLNAVGLLWIKLVLRIKP